ncbi:malto-oligosyltrehalose synthase [Citreimonas salinaria]|uniref:Maltooligosyl trehalose synthase n=1 Tax=Citreimonas salinaria TaxID=321339 RepID=A0A1H3H730_9RHOB|nr:malto-oligosyltrehalose synthase [Citreimonas salinaria]SDY11261.1 maltooligosyl trehalose synthase [Citreimonas salinaria]
MIRPTATYRLQLRDDVTFDDARTLLPTLAGLGFSHLYLSPIFTATEGSAHGYDVTDPAEIDPCLGGEAAFVALAQAAHDAGLGIVLDIVPNHTAFTVENPWLRDVLRHGADSRYARHFDIDWTERLVLPWLAEPFDTMLESGRLSVSDGVLKADALEIPLAPGTGEGDVADVLDRQPWRLTHWVRERDGITHRRFFTVTDLIGMRIEDDAVFEDCHAKIFDLIDRGLVDALRIDHVDGLADPESYLHRLRDRVGDIPVWVEKILTDDEVLPDWPVEGTTGYEAARHIARLLTDADGHAMLLDAWSRDTALPADFHAVVRDAKNQVLREELAAELLALIDLGQGAVAEAGDDHGAEAVREAVIGLLIAFPRYRTYFRDGLARDEDRALMARAADDAAAGLRSRTVVDLLVAAMIDPKGPAGARFRTRFQQVTGALIAKAHEDTAAFRQTAFLAACEVGADPDDAVGRPPKIEKWCARRDPHAMTLTSSHDTKRSEDSRMRLVAMSHLPDAFLDLLRAAQSLPGADAVRPQERWYMVQAALAVWDEPDPTLETRLADHLIKALREGKDITTWTHTNDEAEAAVLAFADALCAAWRRNPPPALDALIARGEMLGLAQLALKMTMPGVPDVYRGAMGPYLALTDPDNRRPVDPARFETWPQAPGFAGDKFRLGCALLGLRQDRADFFDTAETRFGGDGGAGELTLTRQAGQDKLDVTIRPADAARPLAIHWNGKTLEYDLAAAQVDDGAG